MQQATQFFNRFNLAWSKAINIGITNNLPFEERRVTRLLNLFAVTGLPACLVFAALNISQARFPLALINLTTAFGAVIILVINLNRKYLIGRFVLSLGSIFLFSTSSILYNNGTEYFLLLNIIATLILFDNKVYVLSVATLNAMVFMYIKAVHTTPLMANPVPSTRELLNTGWTLFFIIIALYYYKSEHINYHKLIELSNVQLMQHQQKLMLQKDELENKSQQLQVLNDTKEKLFSIIAHDMRSPIASLKSSLDLYHNNEITQVEYDLLKTQLTEQVDHLYNNLDNLLRWSQTQLSGLEAKPVVSFLKPLMAESIALLQQNAVQKEVTIEDNTPGDLLVYADKDHVKVIVRNLLSNAIKFSHPHSCIEIGGYAADMQTIIYLKDDGIGMSNTTLNTLFNTHAKPSQSGTRNEKGMGLGLALCKEFIDKNRGTIIVESEVGKGSIFIISLPAENFN